MFPIQCVFQTHIYTVVNILKHKIALQNYDDDITA